MYFQQNIKYLRKGKGLNQTQVGEAIGVSKEAVSSYETGRKQPTIETLLKLCQLFSVSLDELILRNIMEEGITQQATPIPKSNEEMESLLKQVNKLLEDRVMQYAKAIKESDPELARELGIE